MKVETLIREALREDLGRLGDVTTKLFVPARTRWHGSVRARQAGVICGTRIAAQVFRACDPGCKVRVLVRDGGRVRPGQAVLAVSGGRGLLTAERTALNFLQRLSGVATATSAYVAAVRGTKAAILDTRKTLPGWRALEKYAVRCGGGRNHRMGLYDAVMVKDNHWLKPEAFGEAVRRLRRRHPSLPLIMEADDLRQVRRGLEFGADVILLDNMPRPRLRRAIRFIRKTSPKTLIEVSGGVGLKGLRPLARLGPDRISVGRITHSAPALDLGLDLA
ncbi:MAG: carboxylating nicotinate-nucleotide diphosphorylase [Elusimicrobia bacterium]|nr:carboxylating nicotinate-nucleotide diphosphorylase [Elusimicrobiota bacterium]